MKTTIKTSNTLKALIPLKSEAVQTGPRTWKINDSLEIQKAANGRFLLIQIDKSDSEAKKEKLIELLKNGTRAKEIAYILKMSVNSVYQIAHRLGIRIKKTKLERKIILNDAENLGCRTAAKIHGIKIETIYSYRRAAKNEMGKKSLKTSM